MITADTITDEQIHSLFVRACGTSLADVDPDLMHVCTVAHNKTGVFTFDQQRNTRRVLVDVLVELLNERAKAGR